MRDFWQPLSQPKKQQRKKQKIPMKFTSIFLNNPSTRINSLEINEMDGILDVELGLESLALSGIRRGDYGLNFLWRNCKNIKKLQLRSCESLGDYASFSGFVMCSKGLQKVELRGCRSIG
ncbi:RNI-like superfamily protein [Abeliophyllum distichum]|uniref:RNI-like superfamily protein n=1 Tax=Abeliophyllum distichum TaxID=126358 RepID=A0ABD1V1Q2_9LAMI